MPFHWPNFFSSSSSKQKEQKRANEANGPENNTKIIGSQKEKQRKKSAAQCSDIKTTPNSNPILKKPKKVKGGKKSTKTKNFHTVTFSQGAGYRAPPKEDRIIAIEDLYCFVHSNYSSYNVFAFGESKLPEPPSKIFIVPEVKSFNTAHTAKNPLTDSNENTDANLASAGDQQNNEISITADEDQSPVASLPSTKTNNTSPGLSSSAPDNSSFLKAPLARGIQLFRSETTGSEMTPSIAESTVDSSIDKFKLFAVFDGHCGKIAASFLQYRFPFELCGSPAFKQGNYEQALKDTYQNMHQLLKTCQKYGPERPYSDYSSGATASVALVTPTMTYFAFLGDSPIITWKHNDSRPEMLFDEHDADNPLVQKNLLESNIFLVLVREKLMSIVYYLVTQPMVKQALFRMAHEKQVEGGNVFPRGDDPHFLGSNSEYDTEFDYTEQPSHDDSALDSPLEAEEEDDDEDDDEDEREVHQIGLIESNSEGELRDPGSPLSATDEDTFPETDIEPLSSERKSYKEARLDDDHAKVVVRSEEEILREETERINRSMKKLSVDANGTDGVHHPENNPQETNFKPDSPDHDSNFSNVPQTTTYTVPGETLEYDDIRVGLSALNVYGSIGDTAYDPDVFNTFLDEILAFKEERIKELEATRQERYWEEMANFTVMSTNSGVIPFTHNSVASSSSNANTQNNPYSSQSLNSGNEEEFDPNDFSFEEFRDFIMGRPAWEKLQRHMFLMKSEDKCSRILLAAIRYLDHTHRLTKPGLLRVPETTSIPTKDLKMFIVTSDGVIRFYEKFKEQFQSMIMRHEQNPERLASKLKDYMKWLGDDRSIIICRLGSQANTSSRKNSTNNQSNILSSGSPSNSPPVDLLPSKKVVSSKKLYHQLRNKRSTVTLPPHQVTTTTNPNAQQQQPSYSSGFDY